MVSIQMVSARIGRVTGHGLATNIRKHYPAWLLYAVVLLLLVATTINIAADVSAMGDAVTLLVGGPAKIFTIVFGVGSLVLQLFVPYHRYVRVLKWLTMALTGLSPMPADGRQCEYATLPGSGRSVRRGAF